MQVMIAIFKLSLKFTKKSIMNCTLKTRKTDLRVTESDTFFSLKKENDKINNVVHDKYTIM